MARKDDLYNMDLKKDYSIYRGDIIKDGKPIGYVDILEGGDSSHVTSVAIRNNKATKEVPKYVLRDIIKKFSKQGVTAIYGENFLLYSYGKNYLDFAYKYKKDMDLRGMV